MLARRLQVFWGENIGEEHVLSLYRILALGDHDEEGGRFLKAQKKMPRAKICPLGKSMGFLNYTTLPNRDFTYYNSSARQRAEDFRFDSVFAIPEKRTLLAFSCSDGGFIDELPLRPGKVWCEMDIYGVVGDVATQDAPRHKPEPDLGRGCWTSELRRTVIQ